MAVRSRIRWILHATEHPERAESTPGARPAAGSAQRGLLVRWQSAIHLLARSWLALAWAFRRTVYGAFHCVVLSACAPAPLTPWPTLAVPSTYRETGREPDRTALGEASAEARRPGAALTEPGDGWWHIFGDAWLDAWIARAEQDNPGLAQAAARVARAAATLGLEAAQAQPQLGVNAGVSRQVGALVNAAGGRGNLFTAGLDFRWDADLLQRLSRQQQSALHDLQAQQALLRQARLVLQAEVTQTYLAWRSLEAEQQALAAVLHAERRLVALAERQVAAGLAAQTLRRSALAELRADEAEAQALARRQALLVHALIALAGGEPAPAVPRRDTAAAFSRPDKLPTTAESPWPEVPAGLPSRMLQRRPDVAAAEASLQAARLRLGLARDAWFPTLALTANAGLASGELSQWLRTAARQAGLGLLLSLPVFDGGRTEAERAAAEAVLAEATAAHRGQVVQALREVDDQLATLRTLALEAEARAQAAALAGDEARRAQGQWQRGLIGEAEVWQTERTAQRQRRLWLQAQAARGAATVALVRALGGGWAEAAQVPAAVMDRRIEAPEQALAQAASRESLAAKSSGNGHR